MSFTSFFDFRALKKMGVEPRRNSHPKTPEKNAKNRRKFWCKTSDLSAFIFLIKIWKTPETRYRPGVAAKCRSLHILRTFCKTGPRDFVILDTFFSKNCLKLTILPGIFWRKKYRILHTFSKLCTFFTNFAFSAKIWQKSCKKITGVWRKFLSKTPRLLETCKNLQNSAKNVSRTHVPPDAHNCFFDENSFLQRFQNSVFFPGGPKMTFFGFSGNPIFTKNWRKISKNDEKFRKNYKKNRKTSKKNVKNTWFLHEKTRCQPGVTPVCAGVPHTWFFGQNSFF